MGKNELESIICLNTKPIYIGKDLTGYFISKSDFKMILDLLNEATEQEKVESNYILSLAEINKLREDVEILKLQLSVSESNRKYAENESNELHKQIQIMKEKLKENELLKADNELLNSKWEAQGLMIQKLHKEIERFEKDFEVYDKVHMTYDMMKNLLIEMNGFGDLKGYDVVDIFELIGELEQNN